MHAVTRLRLTSDLYSLPAGLTALKECSNLEELDVEISQDPCFRKCEVEEDLILVAKAVAEALASLHLKRLGLHASGGCWTVYIPVTDGPNMHRSFCIGDNRDPAPLEEQIDQSSRHNVTRLALHLDSQPSLPSLSGFSALKQLVIADTWWQSDDPRLAPFSLEGLDAIVGTLEHLIVSSSRAETCVDLPDTLRLRSLVCVCSGTLLLHCDAHTLGQTLGDVLLGYTSVAGTGARLVEELSPRLEAAVLEVHGFKRLRQSLLFTRAGLVGEWWHGVFQVSKQQGLRGGFCCRSRMWAHGCPCPPYLVFPRYGIVSAHEDRWVLNGEMDLLLEEREVLSGDIVVLLSGEKYVRPVYPNWHTAKYYRAIR